MRFFLPPRPAPPASKPYDWRLIDRFAVFPTRVCSHLIWLERYVVTECYEPIFRDFRMPRVCRWRLKSQHLWEQRERAQAIVRQQQ